MRKSTVLLLMFSLLALSVPTTFAQINSDWNTVVGAVGREIAVKVIRGGTIFGILRAATDGEIKVETVGKRGLPAQERTFRRDEVEKVWSATLSKGERQIVKGALIGAGVGTGVGLIAGGTTKERDIILTSAGIFGVAGAAIGALAGAFSKKGNSKNRLVYTR